MKLNHRELQLFETVLIKGIKGNQKVKAKVDTGADRTCIDMSLAAELHLGPIIDTAYVKSEGRRVVVPVKLQLRGKIYTIEASLSNRKSRKTMVLLGRDILRKGGYRVTAF